jgi:hypothetical protein
MKFFKFSYLEEIKKCLLNALKKRHQTKVKDEYSGSINNIPKVKDEEILREKFYNVHKFNEQNQIKIEINIEVPPIDIKETPKQNFFNIFTSKLLLVIICLIPIVLYGIINGTLEPIFNALKIILKAKL